MDLSIHVCAHKALHGAKGSGDGKQRKLVCDQGGASSSESVALLCFQNSLLFIGKRCIEGKRRENRVLIFH